MLKKMMILKMQKYLTNNRDLLYIGSTCDTLSKCISKLRIKSKSRVNWSYDNFYMIISRSYINCKIELIKNYPCNNAEELKKNIYMKN